MSLLIKNISILQFYPQRLEEDLDILIEGNKIKQISKNININAEKIINGKGKFIIPGIVCAHNHFYSALARGIMVDLKPSYDFIGVLKNLWWRLDVAIDEDILYYSGLIGAIEAIKSGTTSVIDHNASPSFIKGSLKVLKEAFEKVGLRGSVCYEVTCRNRKTEGEEGVKENIDFIESYESDLVKGLIGAHAPFTIDDKTMELLKEAIKSTGRGIHIHVVEDKYDLSYSHHYYDLSAIERLDKFELLNENSLIIHGVHLLDKDIKLINERKSFLVHNARSNMNNNVGYLQKLHELNKVALGTDGIGSDMFEETKFAYFKSKDAGSPFFPDKYMKYLYNGNLILKTLFNENFGEVKEGFIADLVIIDYISPTPLVAENAAGHFIFGMNSSIVDTTIINGKIVYENKKFPFDITEIYKKAQKAAEKLWNNM